MKENWLFLKITLFLLIPSSLIAQEVKWETVNLKNETSRTWKEGWLIVPENRVVPPKLSNSISMPFILSKSEDKNSLLPIVIMSGGPGNGSIHMANGMTRMPWAQNRDLIFMDQRGTLFSKPTLHCREIDEARKNGVNNGLYGQALENALLKATEKCYKKWTDKNVDLSGYNTLESVEDLEALRQILGIDKWILYGMSYSCNLMATYAQTYPDHVAGIILDSPLPHQVNYDEDAAFHFDQAFVKALGDDNSFLYGKWLRYINSIKDSVFRIEIKEKQYPYTYIDLINVIGSALSDHEELKKMNKIVNELMAGNHERVKGEVSSKLGRGWQAKGMRYSVWLTEEWPEQSARKIRKNYKKIPWLKEFVLNDINPETAKIWKVRSVYKSYTWPTNQVQIPALILCGELDPWTPPSFGLIMKDIFPKAELKIYQQMTHVPGFTDEGIKDIEEWLDVRY